MSCQRFGFARARPQGSAGVGLSRQGCGPRDRLGGSGARGSGLGLPGENFRRGSLLQLHVLGCSTGGVGSPYMEFGPQIGLAEAYLQLVSAVNLVKNWGLVGCSFVGFCCRPPGSPARLFELAAPTQQSSCLGVDWQIENARKELQTESVSSVFDQKIAGGIMSFREKVNILKIIILFQD